MHCVFCQKTGDHFFDTDQAQRATYMLLSDLFRNAEETRDEISGVVVDRMAKLKVELGSQMQTVVEELKRGFEESLQETMSNQATHLQILRQDVQTAMRSLRDDVRQLVASQCHKVTEQVGSLQLALNETTMRTQHDLRSLVGSMTKLESQAESQTELLRQQTSRENINNYAR